MKAIIFGINGQDGYYLSDLLAENNIEVVGVSRRNSKWMIGDVSDFKFVESLIQHHKPAYIFHFAANSTTIHEAVFENHETISTGTLNILESVYKHSPETKVFVSGSGLQFVNSGGAISENDEFEANTPYSVSRIQSVYAARYYRMLGLKVYVGYFFNHDSPLRSERHINQKIVNAVKNIHAGSIEQVEVGNVHVQKEFSFAKDIVEAVWILVSNNDVFETVIGSGIPYSIADWLNLCFSYYNKNWQDYTVINSSYKPSYDRLFSDPTTILSLGWKCSTSIESLAKMMIEHAR